MKKMYQEMSKGSLGNPAECGYAIHQGNDGETVRSGSVGVSAAVFSFEPDMCLAWHRARFSLSSPEGGEGRGEEASSLGEARTPPSPTLPPLVPRGEREIFVEQAAQILQPKTRGGMAGDQVESVFVLQSESARRRLERPRRSRSLSESFQKVGTLSVLLLLGTIVHGQEIPADRVSVPFRDPSHPGVVKVNLMTGGITVKGYDGKEVVVEASLRGSKSSKKDKPDNKAEGLKRIDVATTGLTVEEEDNVVSVSTGPMSHAVDVCIQVPASTSLKLVCMNDGILVEKVTGEIEANNLNGPVTLTNVSGVVIAH